MINETIADIKQLLFMNFLSLITYTFPSCNHNFTGLTILLVPSKPFMNFLRVTSELFNIILILLFSNNNQQKPVNICKVPSNLTQTYLGCSEFFLCPVYIEEWCNTYKQPPPWPVSDSHEFAHILLNTTNCCLLHLEQNIKQMIIFFSLLSIL